VRDADRGLLEGLVRRVDVAGDASPRLELVFLLLERVQISNRMLKFDGSM